VTKRGNMLTFCVIVRAVYSNTCLLYLHIWLGRPVLQFSSGLDHEVLGVHFVASNDGAVCVCD
jgi:hypothetical protein